MIRSSTSTQCIDVGVWFLLCCFWRSFDVSADCTTGQRWSFHGEGLVFHPYAVTRLWFRTKGALGRGGQTSSCYPSLDFLLSYFSVLLEVRSTSVSEELLVVHDDEKTVCTVHPAHQMMNLTVLLSFSHRLSSLTFPPLFPYHVSSTKKPVVLFKQRFF